MIDVFLSYWQEKGIIRRQQPASCEALEKVQRQLAKKGIPQLPQSYLDFLSKRNGLSFGAGEFYGEEFYGTASILKHNSDFVLKENNIRDYVLLGSRSVGIAGYDRWYVYNIKTKRYEFYKDCDVCEDFETFMHMFAAVFRIELRETE